MFRGAGPSDGSKDYPVISIDLGRSGAASDDFGSARVLSSDASPCGMRLGRDAEPRDE